MIANLVAHVTQFTVWQKDQYSSRYSFPKYDVLLIDSVLRVTKEGFGLKYTTYISYTFGDFLLLILF